MDELNMNKRIDLNEESKYKIDLDNTKTEVQEENKLNINKQSTKSKKIEPSTIIYNTENYKQYHFGLQFIIFDAVNNEIVVDKFISPDKVIIWKFANLYGLVDIYSATSDVADEIQEIINQFRQIPDSNCVAQIRLYPEIENNRCYLKTKVPLSSQVVSCVTTNTRSKKILSQALIDSDMDIFYEGKLIEHINVPFEEIVSTNVEINKEEEEFIEKTIKAEKQDDWFIEKPKKKKENKLKIKPKETKQQENKATVQTSSDEIFDPSILKVIKGSSNPMEDMNSIIGLDNVKHEIEKLKYTLEYKKERLSRGIKDESSSSMHMCFYGSPGTGKTTVARIMTGLLYEMGYIKENKCIEINGLEFKGGYVGQTEIITKSILDYSKGGILFVDEAYALCSNSNDTYGQEAVNTFIKEMEDNRDSLTIIFAGYEEAMETFLNMNTGFRSRINRYFKFEDYNTIQLTEIFIRLIREKHLKIDEKALQKCVSMFKKAQQYNDFGNGRFVNNLLEKIEEEHIMNVIGCTDNDIMDTITQKDVSDELCDNLIKSLKY